MLMVEITATNPASTTSRYSGGLYFPMVQCSELSILGGQREIVYSLILLWVERGVCVCVCVCVFN